MNAPIGMGVTRLDRRCAMSASTLNAHGPLVKITGYSRTCSSSGPYTRTNRRGWVSDRKEIGDYRSSRTKNSFAPWFSQPTKRYSFRPPKRQVQATTRQSTCRTGVLREIALARDRHGHLKPPRFHADDTQREYVTVSQSQSHVCRGRRIASRCYRQTAVTLTRRGCAKPGPSTVGC